MLRAKQHGCSRPTTVRHSGLAMSLPIPNPETLALGRRCGDIFAKLGWRGPLNIQCQLDRHGRVTIHEFNGRFGALAAERWLLGYDEVAHGIELFTGFTLPPTSWHTLPARSAVAQLTSTAVDPVKVDYCRLPTRTWRMVPRRPITGPLRSPRLVVWSLQLSGLSG